MANPATAATLTTAADTITLTNRGAPYDDDAQVIFEFSTATTFVGAVLLFQTQRTSTSEWTNAAVFDLSALGSSLTGNQTLTDSTNYSFIMPYASGFYGKRAKLVNTLGSGTISASAEGRSVKESVPMPIPVVISSQSVATTITAASATAFVVGPNGTTNPAFSVATNAGSAATGLTIVSAAAASRVALNVISSGTDEGFSINAKGAGTILLNPTGTGSISSPRAIVCTGPATGIGYAVGAGAAVSQATDRTTGVTCTGMSGAITTQATSLAAGATVQFTVTNTSVAVGDTVICSIRSGPTNTTTSAQVVTVAAGSFKIALVNHHASVADTGAAIINFAVIKAVSS